MSCEIDWESLKHLNTFTNRRDVLQCLQKLNSDLKQNNTAGRFLVVGEKLLDSVKPSVLNLLLETEQRELFFDLFIECNAVDVMLLFGKAEPSKYTAFSAGLMLRTMERFFRRRLKDMLVTLVDPDQRLCSASSFGVLCQAFARMPDRLAVLYSNRVAASKLEFYHREVGVALATALRAAKDRLRTEQDCSLQFHSRLVGKLCMAGYGKQTFQFLIPYLLTRTAAPDDGGIWMRISSRIFVGVPEIAQERVLTDMLPRLSDGRQLYRLIGDAVTCQQRIRLLLTKTVLFIRQFESTVPRIVIQYLALQMEPEGQNFVKTIFTEALDVWSCPSAICHCPVLHRLYLGQVLLTALKHLTKDSLAAMKDLALQKAVQAMSIHLDSPRKDMQSFGIVVFRCVNQALGLKYDDDKMTVEDNELTRALRAAYELDQPNFDPPEVVDSVDLSFLEIEDNGDQDDCAGEVESAIVDSDDEDVEVITDYDNEEADLSKPAYLEDCMDQLWNGKEYGEFAGALIALQGLLKRNTPGVHDLAVDLVRLLIGLDNRFRVENFDQIRLQCMIACCVKEPLKVAAFLCEEVGSRNARLLRKFEMLKVLQSAALELAARGADAIRPLEDPPASSIASMQRVLEYSGPVGKENGGRSVPNRFSAIAPKFFYPLFNQMLLMNVEQAVGGDRLFLRTAETLITFLIICGQSVYLTSMSAVLLRSLWPLRNHCEPAVRAVLLFCLQVVLQVVPAKLLVAEMRSLFPEFETYLKFVVDHDTDSCCQRIAKTAYRTVLLYNQHTVEIPLPDSKLFLRLNEFK